MKLNTWGCVCTLVVAAMVAGEGDAQNKPLTATPASDAVAAGLTEGLRLQKTAGQEVAARRALNRVYFDRTVMADQKAQARQALVELNNSTIFSATKVFDGDNLAYTHKVRAGDTLTGLAKQSGCPIELIRQINNMKPSDGLKADSTIKLLRGPFHVLVRKGGFTLDVFAQTAGGEWVLMHHARVAIGQNNATPEGLFRVAAKAEKATWFPPASMKAAHPAPVKWGEKGYPLGKDGLFIRLAGAEPATEKHKSIGLHSTSDQTSIGKARSSGCIRIGDKDVRIVYNLLTTGSEVKIVP